MFTVQNVRGERLVVKYLLPFVFVIFLVGPSLLWGMLKRVVRIFAVVNIAIVRVCTLCAGVLVCVWVFKGLTHLYFVEGIVIRMIWT